jgi:hypothetical protein
MGPAVFPRRIVTDFSIESWKVQQRSLEDVEGHRASGEAVTAHFPQGQHTFHSG